MFHELPHLLTNPDHWAFEAISDLVLAVPAYILGRIGIRRHDRRNH
jgi:hypothetical protein